MFGKPSRTSRTLQYLALAGYLIFLGFPLVWLLSTAFKPPRELVRLHPTLIPDNPTLQNFVQAFTEQELGRAALNSLQVSLASAVLTVLVAMPASYALARFRSKLGTAALGWVLLSQLFPFVLLIIPIFLVLRQVGLANTHAGLVLIYVVWALPFALWMLQGFVRNIPRELEEAASVDGATRVQVLRRVVFPLLAPGLVATALFSFISAWNEFFFALVLIKTPELATLPVALARFVGIEGTARLGPLAAGSLLATLPSLIFFAFMQRRLSSGLARGRGQGLTVPPTTTTKEVTPHAPYPIPSTRGGRRGHGHRPRRAHRVRCRRRRRGHLRPGQAALPQPRLAEGVVAGQQGPGRQVERRPPGHPGRVRPGRLELGARPAAHLSSRAATHRTSSTTRRPRSASFASRATSPTSPTWSPQT